MTPSKTKPMLARAMDVIFGARGTIEEIEAAERIAPPRRFREIFRTLNIITVGLVVVALLWSNGWLPFVSSKISGRWLSAALALDLALRFGWEWVVKRYKRRGSHGAGQAA